jgi:hypothetical protein
MVAFLLDLSVTHTQASTWAKNSTLGSKTILTSWNSPEKIGFNIERILSVLASVYANTCSSKEHIIHVYVKINNAHRRLVRKNEENMGWLQDNRFSNT